MQKVKRLRPHRNFTDNSVRLDMAEQNEPFPDIVWERFLDALKSPLSVLAYPDYKTTEELINKIKANIGLNQYDCIIDCGSDAIIKLMIEVLVEDSGTVLSFDPSFPMYHVYSRALSKNSIFLDSWNHFNQNAGYFNLSIDFILDAIYQYKPKLMFLSNPSSPLGGYLTNLDIDKIASSLECCGGILCLDEAYIDFVEPKYAEPNVKRTENILSLRTFSKGWGARDYASVTLLR